MCFLPKLNQIKKKTQTIATFRGLNERKAIADGEFSDCCNISLEEYPAVSVMDGYTQYANSTGYALPDVYVKSKKNIMILNDEDQAGNHSVTAYQTSINSFGTATVTETSIFNGASQEFMLHDFDIYGDKLLILRSVNEEMDMWIRGLVWYKTAATEYIDLSQLLGTDYSFPSGLLTFGSRVIILAGTQIHISYFNDISAAKWTTYNEDGVENSKCAQQIELLDDGNFTGCVNYRDYPIFFKENSMYMLLGEYTPFSLSRIDSVGCHRPNTIAICNGKLYFLSKLGVMEYDGGTPELISQSINIDVFDKSNQYGCADNRYYYIGKYIYDTYTKTWCKQKTNFNVVQPQCYFNNSLYIADSNWITPEGESAHEEIDIYKSDSGVSTDWYFETKQFHEYQEGKKIISKLIIGFEKDSTTALKIEVSLNKGTFQTVYTWNGTTDFVKEVPVLLPPCDYFQVRVSGKGKTIVHYIKREFRVLGA